MYHTYRAHHLVFRMDVSIPGLIAGPDDLAADVEVQRLPAQSFEDMPPRTLHVGPDHLDAYWGEVGRFVIHAGRRIEITPRQTVGPMLVQAYLLGSVLAMLMHQRGHFVLHASALAVNGAGVALSADAGVGKSTFAAYLASRGHQFLTDDVLPLRHTPGEIPRVRPGFPLSKLSPETAAALGISPGDGPAIRAERDKRFTPFPPAPDPLASWPLRRIYLLEDGDAVRIEPVSRAMAVVALNVQSFNRRPAQSQFEAGRDKTRLDQTLGECAWLVKEVPVRRLIRPRDLNALSHAAQALEADLSV